MVDTMTNVPLQEIQICPSKLSIRLAETRFLGAGLLNSAGGGQGIAAP